MNQAAPAAYTRDEVIDLLRTSRRTLTRLLATHNIGQFKVGQTTLFSRKWIDRHLADAVSFPKLIYTPKRQRT